MAGEWETPAETTPDARELFDLYLPLLTRSDVVIAQIGQSLDGRIATHTGHSHYITGRADIRRLHRLRALSDAVVVGARTVAADNPRLTVREVEGPNPVRVVFDPRGRLGRDRHVFSDGAARTLSVKASTGGRTSIDGDIVRVPTRTDGALDPMAVLAALRTMGLRRVLVEGGGTTVSFFLQAGAIDRLHVTVAPVIIGSGPHGLTLSRIDSLEQALRPSCRVFRLGADVLFDLDLRQPSEPS
jgi:riboflavin-specific deaminase-like protein